jgi:NADPH:quinone reductase
MRAIQVAQFCGGPIHPIIGQTFPLEQATDAHHAIEARTVIGKTLLVI